MKIAIVFCTRNNSELTHKVVFDLLDSKIAHSWATEIGKGHKLNETDRFYGWPDDQRDVQYYVDTINYKIDIVNDYQPGTITIRATSDIDQLQLNHLHKFFEILRGEVTESTDFFDHAPARVQKALEEFNVSIHACEEFFIGKKLNPRITISFHDAQRYELTDEDYSKFTFQWKFGHVYLGYSEVGKTILDVFDNQDELVGEDNIRPMRSYTAGCSIRFGEDVTDDKYNKRLAAVNDWLSAQSFTFDPNKLALGLIPVAKLNLTDSGFTGLDNNAIINILSKYLKIKSVSIHE